jgi:hypothetical protein
MIDREIKTDIGFSLSLYTFIFVGYKIIRINVIILKKGQIPS